MGHRLQVNDVVRFKNNEYNRNGPYDYLLNRHPFKITELSESRFYGPTLRVAKFVDVHGERFSCYEDRLELAKSPIKKPIKWL